MVIDDDREMLKLLNRTLELEGFDAIVVTDGNSALTLFKEAAPDLVILDIMMPGLDGFGSHAFWCLTCPVLQIQSMSCKLILSLRLPQGFCFARSYGV